MSRRLNFEASIADNLSEIQQKILKEFYFPGSDFPMATALLRVSKTIYAIAHPVFLNNYLLTLTPLKVSKTQGGPQIEPFTDENESILNCYSTFYHKRERLAAWITGLKKGLQEHFFVQAADPSENKQVNILLDVEASFQGTFGVWGKRIVGLSLQHNTIVATLARFRLDHLARIRHLRILILNDETPTTDPDTAQFGPPAVAIMSALCEVLLPGITNIQICQLYPGTFRYAYLPPTNCEYLCPKSAEQDFIRSLGGIPSPGPPVPQHANMVSALQSLLDSCKNLKGLTLDFYREYPEYIAWPEWWGKVLWKKGLKLDVHQLHHRLEYPDEIFLYQHAMELGAAKETEPEGTN